MVLRRRSANYAEVAVECVLPVRKMIDGIAIEPVDDAASFAALHRLLVEYERSLPADLRHGSEPDLQSVRRTFVEPNVAFLARVDGRNAGCIGLMHHDASTGLIVRLYTRPSHRGRGAGRALAEAAIASARERGYERVVLDTHAERLAAAYNLYRSLGFVDCEPFGAVDYACPTYMERKLDG